MAVRRHLGVVDRHEVLHLADAVLGEEARDQDVGVREVELLGVPVLGASGAARRSRPCPCRGSRRTRWARRRPGSSTSRSCRWCRRARPCAGRRRGRARRSGGSPSSSSPAVAIAYVLLLLVRRDHRRAEHAGLGAVAREPDRRVPAEAGHRVRRGHALRAGSSSRSPASETPPPMTISCGSNRLIALAIPTPSRWPRTSSTRSASASPALAPSTTSWPVTSPSCSSRLPRNESSSSRASRSASRSSARPAARYSSVPGSGCLPSGTRRALLEVEPDHRVADLGGARRAAVEPPVEDHAAADAGADGEHHEVRAHQAAVLVERLGERRARRVVLDVDRDPGLLGQQLAQRQVGERDVDAVRDPAGLELDDRGQADPDRDGVVVAQVARSARRAGPTSASESDTSVLTSSWVVELAVLERRGGDLRAPDVEADELPSIHSCAAAASSRKTNSEPGRRAHARGGRLGVRRVAERARDRVGLVGAGDEEVDLARAVEHREASASRAAPAAPCPRAGRARRSARAPRARACRGTATRCGRPGPRRAGSGRSAGPSPCARAPAPRRRRPPRRRRARPACARRRGGLESRESSARVRHPEVRVRVVGRDAALVGEPDRRVAPVGVVLGGDRVGAARRRAAGRGRCAPPCSAAAVSRSATAAPGSSTTVICLIRGAAYATIARAADSAGL